MCQLNLIVLMDISMQSGYSCLFLSGVNTMFSHHLLLWNSQCIFSKLYVDSNSERIGGFRYRWSTTIVCFFDYQSFTLSNIQSILRVFIVFFFVTVTSEVSALTFKKTHLTLLYLQVYVM